MYVHVHVCVQYTVLHCDTNNEFLKLPMIFLLLVACNRGITENGICMERERRIQWAVHTVDNTHTYMYTCTMHITSAMLSILGQREKSQNTQSCVCSGAYSRTCGNYVYTSRTLSNPYLEVSIRNPMQ